MVDTARKIKEKINVVAELSREEADAILQINEGVEQINIVIQENSSTSQECAAASEEMVSQAEVLKNLIEQFNVRNV